MKRFIILLTAFLYLFPCTMASAESKVTLYAPDGRTVTVYNSQVSSFLKVGWYKSYSEVTTKLYAPDGRQITVYNSQVADFLKVGWFKNYKDVTTKLYAPDGRQITVYNSQVADFLKVGWYKNYSDVTTTLYAPGGKTITVYNSEVPSYLNVGWSKNKSSTMYNIKEKVINEYKYILKQNLADEYMLFDINKDGIAELILCGPAVAITAGGNTLQIYSYSNGKVVKLKNKDPFFDVYHDGYNLFFEFDHAATGGIYKLEYDCEYSPYYIHINYDVSPHLPPIYTNRYNQQISHTTYTRFMSSLQKLPRYSIYNTAPINGI